MLIQFLFELGANPPTREEFRAICDQCQTADEIVKLLEEKFGSLSR